MSADVIANDGDLIRHKHALDRSPFLDTDTVRARHDGALALEEALNEGYTDFVIIAMRKPEGAAGPHEYCARLFSRPRPRPVLLHILQTADMYVQQTLPSNPS